MKYYTLTLLVLLSSALLGQKPLLNQWSVSASFGGNKPINPYASGYFSNTICFPSVQLGGRYMMNSFFGIGLDAGYNQFKFDQFGDNTGSEMFKTNYVSFSALAIANAGQALKLNSFAPRLGLLVGAGIGVSSQFNDSLKLGSNNGSDEMANFRLQLSPMFRISDKLSIFAQLGLNAHMYQNRTFDMTDKVLNRGLDGFLVTGTVGFNVSLGKNKTHSDWFSEDEFIREKLVKTRCEFDSLVTTMQDSDHDGVPNYLDKELQSDSAAKVSTHGITQLDLHVTYDSQQKIDFETVDGFVEFPEKLELFYTVQVGYYELTDSVDYISEFGIEAIKKELPNGAIRYLHGYFDDNQTAQKVRDALFSSSIIGAFVTPYFRGMRITNAQAEKLLLRYGRILLYPPYKKE